jgi:hypothetical protein
MIVINVVGAFFSDVIESVSLLVCVLSNFTTLFMFCCSLSLSLSLSLFVVSLQLARLSCVLLMNCSDCCVLSSVRKRFDDIII